jgi:hypothetical protein
MPSKPAASRSSAPDGCTATTSPGFIRTVTPAAAGTEVAEVDWQAVIASRDAAQLPCSDGENRVLRLEASIAAGIPAGLNHALSGLDHASITLVHPRRPPRQRHPSRRIPGPVAK